MDIIFHIGFPKCASTTLQNQVFSEYAQGYLGAAKTMGSESYAKEFQRYAPVGIRIKGNMKLARKWANEVINKFKAERELPNTFVASSEMYSNWNKLKDRPIIDFLKKYSDEVWTYGDVKILIIIRNQAEILASGYVQSSGTDMYASQANFNQKVMKQIRRKSPYLKHLNYAKWIKELNQNFGTNNVCTLLMEEIDQITFWRKLKEFCQLNAFDPKSMLKYESYNSRRASKSTWKISPFDAGEKAKNLADKVLWMFWPHYVFSEKRKKTHQILKQQLAKYYETKYSAAAKQLRDNKIVLTDDLEALIKEYFKPMNKQLELLLKTDLSEYGYY